MSCFDFFPISEFGRVKVILVRLDEILNKSCHERNRKHLHNFLNILRIVPIYLGQLNYKDSLSPVIVCPQ